MANTRGYEVVVEASEEVLRKVIRGAWKSAECDDDPGDEGRIPEFMDVPAGETFGGFVVADGSVQIPEDQLDASLRPDITGAEIQLGVLIQIEIENPPVPSAQMLTMTADLAAAAPIGLIPGRQDVGWLLDGLPRSQVSATLTSGDPIASNIELFASEFVDKAYENGGPGGPIDPAFPSIPHVIDETALPFALGALTTDVHAEIFNDDSVAAHDIETTVSGGDITISLPVYLRMFNIVVGPAVQLFFNPQDPMGIETRINITAPFSRVGSEFRTDLNAAIVTVDAINPAGPEYGPEGDNYIDNRDQLAAIPLVAIDLDAQISSELVSRGQELASGLGEISIAAPTVAEIEEFIGDFFHRDLEARDFVYIWGPEATDEEFEVDSITVGVTNEFLAIALNDDGGGDVGGLANFIPADRDFAIAISAAQVEASIETARIEAELSDDDLPKTFTPDGREVRLTDLDVSLRAGAIRISGKVTVVDAILGSIDVDADFFNDVGLRWQPNGSLGPDGGQQMDHFEIDSDVDPEESVLLWVLTAIAAILSFGAFGILGALVVVIVALVVRGIAESMGSEILSDEVTNTVTGITGWPENLARIGRVEAVFSDPIVIDTDGLEIAGDFTVISSCEATDVVPADSGGARSGAAASAMSLAAVNEHPDAGYEWLPGDGTPAAVLPSIQHVYAASGVYTAKHALTMNQPGGARSRSFSLVTVENVPPTVDAGPDLTVQEGEEVTLVARFRDVEYPDTHESMWYFGDHHAPKPGVISETNGPPAATGTSTVTHAWCDNGEYTVTVRIRDVNGGEAIDTLRVTVTNVPPKVEAGPDLYAYVCTPITLVADFRDPGWCDTHTAKWDFGDCSEPRTALIEETNEPPAAEGTATASHIYENCGDFRAICTVMDDDGAFGQDDLTVRVVHLLNPGFEDGFRSLPAGNVGRFWTPYAWLTDLAAFHAGKGNPVPQLAPIPADAFDCEGCIVRTGDRSQRVIAQRGLRVGLWQSLGSNPGWDYEFSCWFTTEARSAGSYALGLDPRGGDDPRAAWVEWWTGDLDGAWRQLRGRVTAEAEAVTVFLEFSGDDPRNDVLGYIDDCAFIAIQPHCPDQPKPDPEIPPRERCIDFRGQKLPSRHPVLNVGGVRFLPTKGSLLQIIGGFQPQGTPKLLLSIAGVFAHLPVVADWARLKLSFAGGKPITIIALDAAGNVLTTQTGTQQQGVQVIEVQASGMVTIAMRAQEAALIELCFRPEHPRSTPSAEPEPGPGIVVNPRFDRAVAPAMFSVAATEEDKTLTETNSNRPFGLSEAAWGKLDTQLQSELAKAVTDGGDGHSVQVILRLAPDTEGNAPSFRRAETKAREDYFRRRTRPLVGTLENLGGAGITELWLIDSVAVELSPGAIATMANDPSVVMITHSTERQAIPENPIRP
ncbi:PKD domain-containing protein [Ruegeria sp. YS9]|uniref:PKD domain-containing protein n=1 Tax=Ruegeria sp. YS9 TaxID=2966453 RepID=UPI00214CE820|nr:PKD domain-containing protein [Ruegeria sp. YS9]UUV07113.1 PKD domain-containing protein [Ruegeria sp. YS9]